MKKIIGTALVAGVLTVGGFVGAGMADAETGWMPLGNGQYAPPPPPVVSSGPGGPSQNGGSVPDTLIVWNSKAGEHQEAENQGDWLSTQEALESGLIEPIG